MENQRPGVLAMLCMVVVWGGRGQIIISPVWPCCLLHLLHFSCPLPSSSITVQSKWTQQIFVEWISCQATNMQGSTDTISFRDNLWGKSTYSCFLCIFWWIKFDWVKYHKKEWEKREGRTEERGTKDERRVGGREGKPARDGAHLPALGKLAAITAVSR